MSRHGADETERLRENLQGQLQRLLVQLQDLEDLREELDDDEYEEVRQDTLEQMKDIDAQLKKLIEGNMTLVTELGSMKMAIQAAIKDAFRTPEVIRMFAQKEPEQLRLRLQSLQEQLRLGRIAPRAFTDKAVEVILALRKLGEELRPEEWRIVENDDEAMRQFEAAENTIKEDVVTIASRGVAQAGGAAGRGDDV